MFYDRLKRLCTEKGITITTLVKDLKMSTGNISRWKAGGEPRADTILQIADYLDTPVEYLIDDGETQTEREIVEEVVEILEDSNISVFSFDDDRGAGTQWVLEHHSTSMMFSDYLFRRVCNYAYKLAEITGERSIPDTFLSWMGIEPLGNLSEEEELLIHAYRKADAAGRQNIVYTCQKELRKAENDV